MTKKNGSENCGPVGLFLLNCQLVGAARPKICVMPVTGW